MCKYVNGKIKGHIALTNKKNYNQNNDEDSNSLSATSINNCKTSENNVISTTETPNDNDVINDDLAAPIRKEKFPISIARTIQARFK